jgi:protoporphyrin/coproporphyrin ferrochelatase
MGRVGVLLLNLGGPEQLSDVRPFLYNLVYLNQSR